MSYWNFLIQTNRKIESKRRDIVVMNYKRKTFLLIDISLPPKLISKLQDLQKEMKKKI